MQTTSSRESAKSSSSAELVSFKVHCPLETFEPPIARTEIPTIIGLVALNTSLDESLSTARLNEIKTELISLGQNDEERMVYLQQRLESLKEWIRDSFGIEDPHKVSEVQSPKDANLTEEILKAVPVVVETNIVDPNHGFVEPRDGLSAGRKGSADEIKPVIPLRIKLVDDKSRIGTHVLRTGTGSKNLSRMINKPAEPTAETKAKAANQTPINVFWNYIEPFFKPIDENDLRILEDTSKFVDPTPFTIPALGKHYEEKWKEQYGYICGVKSNRRRPQMSEETGSHPSLKVASIRERLLAMMIEENLTVPETELMMMNGDGAAPDNEVGNDSSSTVASPPPDLSRPKLVDFIHVDERIKKELSQSGLCMFVPKIDYQEDDQVCAEIRTLQRKLCEIVCINHYRKRKLATIVRDKLGAQEFYTLLEDIDKQLEQTFVKRSKVVKKKKKSMGGVLASSPTPSSSMSVMPLIETRDKLLFAFSDIIPSQHEFLASSQERLFDSHAEGQVLQYARDSGSWLPVPDQPLQHVRLVKKPAHPVFPIVDPNRTIDNGCQSMSQFDHSTIV